MSTPVQLPVPATAPATTGNSADFLQRMKRLLPGRWFADVAPNRDAVMGGLADALAFVYSLFAYVKTQTRISTANSIFLDLIALDFFGSRIVRHASQTDASFITLIKKELLRDRVTVPAMSQALLDLTGFTPVIVEPNNPQTTACLNKNAFLGAGPGIGSPIPYTMFITVYDPSTGGIPYIAGISAPQGALLPSSGLAAPLALVTSAQIIGNVTAADIYSMIEATRAAGVTCWVNITTTPLPAYQLDTSFVLNSSSLD